MAKPRKPRAPRPASSKPSAPGPTADDATIEDAVVVDATAEDAKADETPQAADASTMTEPVQAVDEAAETVTDAAAKDMSSEPTDSPDSPASDAAATPEPGDKPHGDERATSMPIAAVVAPPPLPPRQSIFFPLLFGGIVAAVLGAAALRYGVLEGWVEIGGGKSAELQTTIDAQATQITALEASIKGLQTELATVRDAAPDLSPVMGAIEEVSASVAAVSGDVTALKERLDATDTRLASIETQPIPKAELPAEVVAAYEAQMAGMQGALDRRFDAMQGAQDEKLAGIEAAMTARLAEIAAAQAAASDAEAAAIAAAKTAEARAALAEIQAALDSGAGFADPLGVLTATADVTPPTRLAEVAETGVPTLASLQAEFPAVARAALAAATKAAASEGSVDRLTAFFRTQMGARSLEPREGDDPDAVLSRAEAAVGQGDLDTALTEIAALPDAGKAALTTWVAQAEIRRAALAAAQTLSEQLNSN